MPNRLAEESSPYLLQHANNPVNWYPWGEEALLLAKEKDCPIFLSIGYSACHWCHVMEHESFEDEKIASILNENFVSIKVDREERPDLDHIYMNAVMALQQGQGGWPLNVFLTPQQGVFFGGTYWPPRSRIGMPGFDQVLHSVLDAFTNRRNQVAQHSKQITDWLNHQDKSDSELKLERELLLSAARVLQNNFDESNGGFGGAPKFPHCMDLALLVRLAGRSAGNQATSSPSREQMLDMVRISLKKMAYGGIFDHLAGGFARYSVDAHWLVPHFEKMLYDNALLAGVFLDMYSVTNDRFYAMIAEKTLGYLTNYMTDQEGCFHSTEDADSEGEEGKFYVWSRQEILDVLGAEIGPRFCDLYHVTEHGNFEGHNILNMTKSYQQFADEHTMDKQQLRDQMREARQKLLVVRDRRVRPGKDDKVLVSWNALAVSAMSKAAGVLNEEKFVAAATNAADFIWAQMRDENGRLLHTWRHGVAKIHGFLDDYANLLVAFLDLYEVVFDEVWVTRAVAIADQMILHFQDPSGGFYFTANDQEVLISRPKSFQDSSVPSGNAMAAFGLIRLGRLVGNMEWVTKGQTTIQSASTLIQRSPLACGQMLIAAEELLAPNQQMVVVVTSESERRKIIAAFRDSGIENSTLICHQENDKNNLEVLPIFRDKKAVSDQVTLYVCSDFSCQEPVVGENNVAAQFQEIAEAQDQTITTNAS